MDCAIGNCGNLGFLRCAQLLMHAISHGGCTDTVRESAPEADWEKNLLPHRGLEHASVFRLAFQSDVLPTELLPPSRPTLVKMPYMATPQTKQTPFSNLKPLLNDFDTRLWQNEWSSYPLSTLQLVTGFTR